MKSDGKSKRLPFKRGFRVVRKTRMFEDDKGYTQVEEYDSYDEVDEQELKAAESKKKLLKEASK